jgi:hypothetical protein
MVAVSRGLLAPLALVVVVGATAHSTREWAALAGELALRYEETLVMAYEKTCCTTIGREASTMSKFISYLSLCLLMISMARQDCGLVVHDMSGVYAAA